jgi:hypothetical protein
MRTKEMVKARIIHSTGLNLRKKARIIARRARTRWILILGSLFKAVLIPEKA